MNHRSHFARAIAVCSGLCCAAVATAMMHDLNSSTTKLGELNVEETPIFQELPDGRVIYDGHEFASVQEYWASDLFIERGLRCGTPTIDPGDFDGGVGGGSSADCSLGFTNASAIYDPSVVKYRIPVVVHVITSGGTGNVPVSRVESQIQVLNEDFNALPGGNGTQGTECEIEFYLATEDPQGNPTTGITYTNNSTWYNDNGSYWNTLAWDTNNYLNIYTNSAGGALGYVPGFPAGGIVGSTQDRVVCYHAAFGDNSPFPPYNLGRTCTHEVGHYLGLYHVFQGCGSNCQTQGDIICDTNWDSTPTNNCSGSSCGSSDPIHNYMDYSVDSCMYEFTPDQARRMRCTLEHWRVDLAEEFDPAPVNDDCLDAPLILVGSESVTTVDATTDGFGESCTGFENDVWYRLAVQCDGTLELDFCDADFDSMIAIYNDCPSGALEALACNDNACGSGSRITMPITAGLYRVRIGGKNGAMGNGTLISSCTPGGNDCPADIDGSGDGSVGVGDLLVLLANWGTDGDGADIADPDDIVDVSDLLGLLSGWGDCP